MNRNNFPTTLLDDEIDSVLYRQPLINKELEARSFVRQCLEFDWRPIACRLTLLPSTPTKEMIEALYGPWISDAAHDARVKSFKEMVMLFNPNAYEPFECLICSASGIVQWEYLVGDETHQEDIPCHACNGSRVQEHEEL